MRSPTFVALTLVAALLVLAPATSSATNPRAGLTPTFHPPAQDRYPRELMQEESFDLGASGALRVDVYDADVEVVSRAGTGATVQIFLRSNDMEWARGVYAELDMSVRREGNTVVVETTSRPSRSWWNLGNRWYGVMVHVEAPEELDVDISTGDGDVAVGNLRGRVAIHTADGDISLARIDGPAIDIRTSDGDVRATSLTAPSIEIETADGDIDVGGLGGTVTAQTSDGDIRVILAGTGEASFETGDGDVRIEMAEAARLEIRTGDGDVEVVVPREVAADVDLRGEDVELVGGLAIEGRVRDGRAEGRINGGGPLIRAETGDGEIRLVAKS